MGWRVSPWQRTWTAIARCLKKKAVAAVIARPCRSAVSLMMPVDPHIIFSRHRETVDYMLSLLGGNVHRARRNNKIFYRGRYVKYPFENGLFDLEPQDRFECLYHYIQNDYPPPKSNFKEWIYHHFGKALAEKYLIPYNEKIWNVPAEELGLEWVEGRVPKPPLEDVVKAACGVETEGYTHQLYFHYPAHGGIESLPRAMAGRVNHIVPDFTRRTHLEGRQPLVCRQRPRHSPLRRAGLHYPYPGTRGSARRHSARDSRRGPRLAL